MRPTPIFLSLALGLAGSLPAQAQSAAASSPAQVVLFCTLDPSVCQTRVSEFQAMLVGLGLRGDIIASDLGLVADQLLELLEREDARPDILKALTVISVYYEGYDPVLAANLNTRIADIEAAGWSRIGLDKTLADDVALSASPN